MIVSGFTQKNVKVEHSHGSALDHSHCVTCVSRTCKVPANNVTSCDVINCPKGCLSRYHGCKENEHVMLCPEERVACINSVFGCPAVVLRKKLAEHLTGCPASIVHCRAEWNRLHIDPVKQGEKRAVLMKKIYADCGQLDTALAMRDHRVLVDRHLFPQQMATKAPDLPLRWDTNFHQLKKKAATCQPAASLSSTSHCIPGQAESISGETGMDSAQRSPEKGKAECCHDEKQDCEVLQDGQALKSVVSLNLSLECIARCQPKASNIHTFLCAQDVRRDEFPHHFYTVHDCIQSDLSGWMEQRCPLAYLGCPFSFRRFRPSLPDMTLRHSWLLESFGVTAQSPQADFSHQTPLHLLPTFAETADSQDTSTECNGPLQVSDGLPLGKSIEYGRVELDPRSSCASSQNCHSLKGKSPLERQREEITKSPVEGQGEESAAPLVNSELSGKSETSDKVSFSNATHPLSSVSGQATQVFDRESHRVDSAENTASAAQNQSDQDNIRKVSSTLPPTHQHPVALKLDGLSQSFSSSTCVKGKQVIYTGLSASSCVRIDTTSTAATSLSDSNREVRTSPSAVQLGDLPSEIMCYITQFLDSFSLYNLSLVSHTMRDLCCTLLQDRGMVSLLWAKQRLGDAVKWRIVGKRWSFSTCFDPVESWRFTGHNPIANHLRSCPYNQDRLQHTEAFSIIPSSETPLNIQIRDMLQDLLQRRRDFRGWIIRSNFDRELITEARPMEGPLADVLVALGGTLPR